MKVEGMFDPEIRKIETEIISYLLNSTIAAARGEITSKILFYFITRKNLTQVELQRLTGYSAGKISQELNNFIDLGLIEISKKTKPWIYSMDSIILEIFGRAINLIKNNLKWESQFLDIKKELEEDKNELNKFNGYDKINNSIKEYLARFEGFKVVLKLWEGLKKKYER